MKHNTNQPTESNANAIPSGVYDVDTIRTECEIIGIEPTRPNIRRMRRAIDLHQAGAVNPSPSATGIYAVQSQTEADTIYVVIEENGCNCPDAKRMDTAFDPQPPHTLGGYLRHRDTMIRCKHEIAVMLWKEQQSDQAMIARLEEEEADRFVCLPEPY